MTTVIDEFKSRVNVAYFYVTISVDNEKLHRTFASCVKCQRYAVEVHSIVIQFFLFYLQIINLSTHAMPPIRLLSKDFIGSMLSSQKQVKPQRDEVAELVETMVISDDENDISPEDEKTLRRKAMEKEEKVMKETGAKKKEAVTTIESKLKSLKLDVIEKFEI